MSLLCGLFKANILDNCHFKPRRHYDTWVQSLELGLLLEVGLFVHSFWNVSTPISSGQEKFLAPFDNLPALVHLKLSLLDLRWSLVFMNANQARMSTISWLPFIRDVYFQTPPPPDKQD